MRSAKIISIVLVVILCLSLCEPAFAASPKSLGVINDFTGLISKEQFDTLRDGKITASKVDDTMYYVFTTNSYSLKVKASAFSDKCINSEDSYKTVNNRLSSGISYASKTTTQVFDFIYKMRWSAVDTHKDDSLIIINPQSASYQFPSETITSHKYNTCLFDLEMQSGFKKHSHDEINLACKINSRVLFTFSEQILKMQKGSSSKFVSYYIDAPSTEGEYIYALKRETRNISEKIEPKLSLSIEEAGKSMAYITGFDVYTRGVKDKSISAHDVLNSFIKVVSVTKKLIESLAGSVTPGGVIGTMTSLYDFYNMLDIGLENKGSELDIRAWEVLTHNDKIVSELEYRSPMKLASEGDRCSINVGLDNYYGGTLNPTLSAKISIQSDSHEHHYKTVKNSNGTYCASCDDCGQFFETHSLDKTAAGVYVGRQNAASGEISNSPYKEGKLAGGAGAVKTGQKYNVVGKIDNAYGNSWYQLSNGNWIFSKYIEKTGDHSYKTVKKADGTYTSICSGCGEEYRLTLDTSSAGVYKGNSKASKGEISNSPYKEGKLSGQSGVPQNGTRYEVVGHVYNAYGNQWYKLSNGNWIFCDYIDLVFTNTSNQSKGYNSPNVIDRDNTKSPSNLTINMSSSTYALGDTVTITPSASNAGSYLASVWYGNYKTGTREYFSDTFNGSVTFKPTKEGLYTIRVDANNVQGRDKGYISAEKTFNVVKSSTSDNSNNNANGSIPGGIYYIEAYCGKVVEVADSKTGNGANVQIWAKSSRDLGCQKFKITETEYDDYYLLIATHSNKAVDVSGGSSASGTNIQQYTVNNSDAQLWQFRDAGDGYFFIYSALGTCMDVYDDGSSNGTNVWAYRPNSTNAQKFRLVDVNTGDYISLQKDTKDAEEKPAHTHNLTRVYASDATCTSAGNLEYWLCEECGNYYRDSSALTAVEYSSLMTAALGHNYVNGICSRCGEKDSTARTGTEVHFSKRAVYTDGQFNDVSAGQWFTDGVAEAVGFGLMVGSSDGFNPYGDVTLAEAITMAARINSIYRTGTESFDQSVGNEWYQTYLYYSYGNGIIGMDYYNSDVTQKATRAQFAEIFAKSLPEDALSAISNISDNAIPDVRSNESYAPYVYRLYRAGILTGGDALGTFSPKSYITRAEAATIVSRMAESNNRVVFSLD